MNKIPKVTYQSIDKSTVSLVYTNPMTGRQFKFDLNGNWVANNSKYLASTLQRFIQEIVDGRGIISPEEIRIDASYEKAPERIAFNLPEKPKSSQVTENQHPTK